MTIDALIMAAGAFITILPFLGFPIKWDSFFMVTVGVFVITLGILVRRRGISRKITPKRTPQSFVESAPVSAEPHEAI